MCVVVHRIKQITYYHCAKHLDEKHSSVYSVNGNEKLLSLPVC